MNYEVIVVGGGHAGCEASLACSKKGHQTLLITTNIKNIADMPCNPSIGGSAKGIVVREIDALGGYMGKNADKAVLQMKMLNDAKGPSVKSLRSQADKITYPKLMLDELYSQNNLTILEATVEDLIINNNKVEGVILEDDTKISSNIVILTTGTYLKSDILVGNTRTRSGPHNEKPANKLSDNLKKYGIEILRLKTGTPPRIKKDSIDFTKVNIEPGSKNYYTFSFDNQIYYDVNAQIPCHITYTTPLTHQIIKDNLDKSSMYGGFFESLGTGPRYCPSIEDKIVKFSDKERHQLFLEPESSSYDDIYIQGFSTSMPHDVQELMVHSLIGLEKAIILKYAYAIEYDAIDPTQLKNNLELKNIENLFTAGQINGTSGYEEAACQGLMAGINASLKLENKEPLILKRNEAYIGVLIDDLITKGTKEPYRLLTSRAEYRLLLRHDNADIRLRDWGYKVGLISEEDYNKYKTKLNNIEELKEYLRTNKLYNILKRPEVSIYDLIKDNPYDKEILEETEIQVKYEGYINKVEKEVERNIKFEEKIIPEDIDYSKVPNLATEARQKLTKTRPYSIGQASRISGVNPSDISVLLIYLKKYYPKGE